MDGEDKDSLESSSSGSDTPPRGHRHTTSTYSRPDSNDPQDDMDGRGLDEVNMPHRDKSSTSPTSGSDAFDPSAERCEMLELRVLQQAREIESLREQLAIVEASLSSDELKRKLLEMVKKNKNLLVNNHSKDAKIKALTAEVERSRDAEADDQGVDVVEVNDYKMKYTKMANDMQGVRQELSAARAQVSRMKKALIAEIGDQVAAEQVIAGGPTVSGYEGRAQQIKRLRREVRALKMQLKVSQNEGPAGRGACSVDEGAGGSERSTTISRLAESRRKQLSELQRETVQLKGKVRELSEVHEAVKSRNRTLTERNQELKEQIAVLMEKSDGDDKVIDEMRVYLDRKIDQTNLPTYSHTDSEGRSVYYPELESLRSENRSLKQQCDVQKVIIDKLGARKTGRGRSISAESEGS